MAIVHPACARGVASGEPPHLPAASSATAGFRPTTTTVAAARWNADIWVIVGQMPSAAVATPQAAAFAEWPRPTSSLASLVAMLVPANPRPAASESQIPLVRLKRNGPASHSGRRSRWPSSPTLSASRLGALRAYMATPTLKAAAAATAAASPSSSI
jgi:hypothetical protein